MVSPKAGRFSPCALAEVPPPFTARRGLHHLPVLIWARAPFPRMASCAPRSVPPSLTCATGLRKLRATIMIKMLPLSLVAVTSVCLLGCDSSQPAPQQTPAPDAPTEAAAAPSGEMTTTASGLKYQVLKSGGGTASPKATDTVRVHYHGTLLNGTVFDSSVQRGQPISFPLNQVISGWTEGLQLMKVGDKFKFEIPANLAYGDQSPSPLIPAGSTLVFEVELLGME